MDSRTPESRVALWTWSRSRCRPSSSALSPTCRSSVAREWSFTSWTVAVVCQSGHVGVAPLAADDEVVRPNLASFQPRREELLCPPVAPGGIDVGDPGRTRGVEHAEGGFPHGVDTATLRKVPVVPKVDVPGPAERGEPHAHGAHGQAGAPKLPGRWA